jgi:hypothetical protein
MYAEAPRQVHSGAGDWPMHHDNPLEIGLVFPGAFAISGFHIEDLSAEPSRFPATGKSARWVLCLMGWVN